MEIVIILIGSFLLKLIGINQSMWLDESISANVAKMPINQIISRFSVGDFHPPLHYWVLNIWVKFFGNQVWVMRLSSILFSLVTIWLIYKIGVVIKNKNTGLWAALLVASNPLLLYYSQELRMYSMVTMLLAGSIYFEAKILKKTNWKNILAFNIFTALSFLTFYGSVFLIAAEILYLFFNKKIKVGFLSSIGIVLAIVGVSPLLLLQLENSQKMLAEVINWSLVLGKVNLKNLLLIPLKFSVGKISWWPKINYYLIGGIWSLTVLLATLKASFKNKWLSFLLIVPLLLGVVFSLKSPLLQYFRFLYLILIMSLLIALINKKLIKLTLVVGFLVFSGIYLLNPNMYRENWKDLVADLSNENNIYMIASFADPIRYYNSDIKINDIKWRNPTEEKIRVIPYGEEIHGVNHLELLDQLGYVKIGEKDYRNVSWEDWEKIN